MTNRGSEKEARLLLEIKDLRIEGESEDIWREIVKGVDLSLNRGEVLGLVGESGAGKSTIGLAAMGLCRPGCRITGGQVIFDGVDLLAIDEEERRVFRGSRIAYVAQSAAGAFNPALRIIDQTIESAVDFHLRDRVAAELDAKSLYDKLGLPNPDAFGNRYPHQVSGGQLQRAMTAMAMSCRPDLIIFDEPTTALDVTTQVEVLAAMRSIVRQFNTAALYISHDLAVVAQMADRIMVLRHGREVEEAPTREILRNPRETYTRTLWAVRKIAIAERSAKKAILGVRAVSASYGTHRVLAEVTFDIPRGRTVAVVGESGSGKSTLARVLIGLLPPEAGSIQFDGAPLPARAGQRSRDVLRRIQMVYQSPDTSLNPRQSIREIIGRPLSVFHGIGKKHIDRRIRELLDQMELGGSVIDRLPDELSGGQKQRVCIARALAADPELIICDEITSALDQIVQEDILKLLLKLQAETNVSYLFISHDIAAVRAIADDILVMHRGVVVEQGCKQEILDSPREPYTRRLLSSIPDMDPDWLTNLLERRQSDVVGHLSASR